MERELQQVSDILREAYKKIEELDLQCRNSVLAACYLEQMQLVLGITLGGFAKRKYSRRHENAVFSVCKILKNSINQYIPWKQFLYYCDQADRIDAFLEFANKLELKKNDSV